VNLAYGRLFAYTLVFTALLFLRKGTWALGMGSLLLLHEVLPAKPPGPRTVVAAAMFAVVGFFIYHAVRFWF
jgi:hypothetical protein